MYRVARPRLAPVRLAPVRLAQFRLHPDQSTPGLGGAEQFPVAAAPAWSADAPMTPTAETARARAATADATIRSLIVDPFVAGDRSGDRRSEEHTSELQS